MKVLSLVFFMILTFSLKAASKHELNFKEPVQLKRVFIKSSWPTNLALSYRDFHYPPRTPTISSVAKAKR